MQLSLVMPTNRHDPLTFGHIAYTCALAGPQIEVIVRDNSGNADKREQIAQFQNDHCRIVSVDLCDPVTNMNEALQLARGDFILLVADDDLCFERAIRDLPALIDEIGRDPSVAGVTAAYAIESTNGTSIDAYEAIDSDDVNARICGYLKYPGPNVLFYSPMRRQIIQRVFPLMKAVPCEFPFHDQILSLLYLLSGKFARMPRVIYNYEMGGWSNRESAQQIDIKFYTTRGIDAAMNKLHWFVPAFEGAALIVNPHIVPGHAAPQRQATADVWFSAMFARFQRDDRHAFGSPFGDDADKLVAKWRTSSGRLTFDNMLTDISGFIALFSPGDAQRYFDFWRAVLDKRDPFAREAAAASA